MDIGTILGLILSTLIIMYTILLGGSIGLFIDIPSIFLTIFGSFTITLINFPVADYIGMLKVIKHAFFVESSNPLDIIAVLVSSAERARREGLLSLEGSMDEIDDDFVRTGLRLAVDGVEPELIKDILQTELAFLEDRHKSNQGILAYMATIAPAMGMIGTLIGLVQMLSNLSDPNAIGPSMAVAILTTLYGAILANVLFTPLCNKLKGRTASEILLKEVIIEGVMSIQAGDNPRILEQKLMAFIPPSQRPPKGE
ncbi:MAG: motility protein A [Candidatus Omnitrophota bacterium]